MKNMFIKNMLNIKNPFDTKNTLKTKESSFFFNKIKIKGNGNLIQCKRRSKIKKCKILIKGNNNKIIVDENTNLTECFIEVIGNNCSIYIGENTIIGSSYISAKDTSRKIHIGRDCMLSRYIQLLTSDGHPIFDLNTHKIINNSGDIIIGNNVWLASDVTILKNTNIGDHVVIGCNSLVTHDIDNNCMAAGVPAKIIKNNIYWSR